MKTPRLLLGIALCLVQPALAEVTKWVDAQGRVHYGDRPPASKDAAGAPMRGTVSVGDRTARLADEGKSASSAFATAVAAPRAGEVWIYTTPTCGYCKRALGHLRERKVRHIEKDVSANAANKAEFRAFGGRGVPVTLAAGGRRINGYNPASYEAFLKSAGF